MGKHIIVFITAILMPFMAYGDNCDDITDPETCNTTPGCVASPNGMYTTCNPCSASTYNTGSNPNITSCTRCDNKPQDAEYITLSDIQTNGWSSELVVTGLTSNTCPWQLTCGVNQEYDKITKGCADCTPGFYNNDNNNNTITYIYNGKEVSGPECSAKTFKITLKYKIDGATYTPEDTHLETVTVSKTEPKLSISAQSYEQTLRNQYNYDEATLSYDTHTCQMKYDDGKFVSENNKCDTLLKTASNGEELTLTLTVTAKEFTYVLVPMNSVESENEITIGIDKNTSDLVTGNKFGEKVTVSSDTEYKQYYNCTYNETNHTVTCSTNPITLEKPTNGFLTLDYDFKYIKDTIIVLERATCTAGQYCPTYTTNGDAPCPDAFWSDKNSATSKTDCYLDSSVTFDDKNGSDKLIEKYPNGTKVYYRGNPTQ